MNKLILLFLAVFLFACQTKSPKAPEKFEIFRGTNLAHWLSQSTKRGEERQNFLKKEDI